MGLAARLNVPLRLVHALADWPRQVSADQQYGLITAVQKALEGQAEKVQDRGAEVGFRIELGQPERVLLQMAREESTKLIVLGAGGQGKSGNHPVGKTADRLAQQSQVPTLIVRAAEPFMNWMKGQSPLRIVVGLDFNLISEDAWTWAQALARVGPVEITGVHVYWPPGEFHRLGLTGLRSYVDADPEVDRVLRGKLEERFQKSGPHAEFRIEPGIGRTSDHLLSVASQVNADLVVVGSHQRNAIERLWEGSVSRGVLHDAQCAVAFIPLSKQDAVHRPVSEFRAALAATDFSPIGNAALEYAYGQVAPSGKVYLLHVVSPAARLSDIQPRDIFKVSEATADEKKAAEDRLRSLIPTWSVTNGRATEVVVVESRDVAGAITQAAERLGADVICLGTHGRSGVAKTVLGSVAQGVLSTTQRPILLVRAPKE